jgi:hypothetical protein
MRKILQKVKEKSFFEQLTKLTIFSFKQPRKREEMSKVEQKWRHGAKRHSLGENTIKNLVLRN